VGRSLDEGQDINDVPLSPTSSYKEEWKWAAKILLAVWWYLELVLVVIMARRTMMNNGARHDGD